MANLTVTCGSCGARFEIDARKAGQSVPCVNCHVRTDVSDAAAAPQTAQGASAAWGCKIAGLTRRAFAALPQPVKHALAGLACLTLGYWLGIGRMTAVRYSAADMQLVSNRATAAEQALTAMTGQYTAMEAERSRYKVAAESREKDVTSIRQRMNELRAEKGVPEWASKEKWAEAEVNLDRLSSENAAMKSRLEVVERQAASVRDTTSREMNKAAKTVQLRPDWDADQNVDQDAKRAGDAAVKKTMGREFSEVSWRRIRSVDGLGWLFAGKVSRKVAADVYREERVTLTMTRSADGKWSVDDIVFSTDK